MRVTYWTPPGVDREATATKAAHDLNQGREVTYHDHAEGKDCSETCWALPEEDG